MKDFLFEAWQTSLSIVRLSYSYLTGGYSCIVCGKKTYLQAVCKFCRQSLFNLTSACNSPRCIRCGKVLFLGEDLCFSCRENSLLLSCDFMFPLFSYRLWNKELLFLWKMQNLRMLSPFFAKMIFEALCKIDGSSEVSKEVIIPVPPRKGKIAEKGWDQIEDLCLFLNKRYGCKICRLLKRNSSVQQKKLKREERLSLIHSAYELKSSASLKKILKPYGGKIPKKVWLLDDVCTTGSTIESCAHALKEAGVECVKVITLFIVD